MLSKHQILYSLVLCLLMPTALFQESPEFAEEYIDEDLPESSVDEEPAAKPVKEPEDMNNKKTNFTEDRFTKLFQPRNRNQNKPNPFLPKHAERVKPTLPSFIKRSPPLIKVTPSTQSPLQNQRFNQRTTPTTQRTTTTRTSTRGSNTNNNRRNQLNGNNNSNNFNSRSGTSTTASPTTTDPSARRRYGSSNRRFNANATIPATTSRPKRS